MTLGAARTVTPLDPCNLAAYAAATGRPENADLRPDSARQLTAMIEQTLGSAASIEADYTDAQLLSTTVLLPAASGETPASSAGAFVQFNPGPFSLRLSVDALGGGATQTDTLYRGARGSSAIDHTDRSEIAGPAVGLSFTKSLDG